MKVRIEKNTYVFDVQVEGGASMAVTLDSGAGCSVWPRGWYAGLGSKLLPKSQDVRMVAANGTDIPCFGQRVAPRWQRLIDYAQTYHYAPRTSRFPCYVYVCEVCVVSRYAWYAWYGM